MSYLVGFRSEERNVLDQLLDTPEDDDLDAEFISPQKKLKSELFIEPLLLSHYLNMNLVCLRV